MTATNSNETQQPQTAIEMWDVQTQALVNPALADAAIESIYENLMGLHGKLKAGGNDKAAARVEEAYNQALSIYHTTTQQRAVIDGGAAAIEETTAQRLQAVTDLQQLLKAIDDGDEMHPQLSGWADQIREDAEMYADDSAMEYLNENLVEQISNEWGFESPLCEMVLSAVLGHDVLTPKQKELFIAFAESLTDEEDPDTESDD